MTDTPEPIPFWEAKSLDEMTRPEWESICDGCARCCLIKLEDEDDGEIYYTNIVCHLLDEGTCRCTDYPNRSVRVPTCLTLTPENVRETSWLPPTCGYRLLNEGHDLYWWHPLVSGDPKTVAEAGVAVTGKVVSEEGLSEWDYEDHVVEWPVEEG